MATPLRSLCPDVFTELEQLAHDHMTDIQDHVTGDESHVTDNDTVTGNLVTGGGSQLTDNDNRDSGDHVTEPVKTSPSSPPPSPSASPSPLLASGATDTV